MKQQQQGADGAQCTHDEARSRYELRLDGRVVGVAQYRLEGDRVVFTHTEVEPAHEGQGLGSRLAGFALDDVRRSGRKAVPQCSFIAGYIARHSQDYAALVAQ